MKIRSKQQFILPAALVLHLGCARPAFAQSPQDVDDASALAAGLTIGGLALAITALVLAFTLPGDDDDDENTDEAEAADAEKKQPAKKGKGSVPGKRRKRASMLPSPVAPYAATPPAPAVSVGVDPVSASVQQEATPRFVLVVGGRF